ncbi:hypothetical protein ACQ7HM_10280 [Williamsia sp. MIQD14]|uniref:hypothetical protein n=1 Tax=Williamsia sp. MIQD14 TaxID=3425703 RepID=UPI003DA01C95
MRDCRKDADRYIAATKILGGATTIAQAPVEGLVRALIDITMTASSQGLRVIAETSTVTVAASTAGFSDEEISEVNRNIEQLQARVDKLVAEANRVDDELAEALSKVTDDGMKSVWKVSGADVDSFVVGALAGAKTDLLAKYGAQALTSADSSLRPWLTEINVLKLSRVGVVGNVAMMIPAIVSDVGGGDDVGVAVAKEAGGALAGIGAAAGTGALVGSVVPVGGTAVGAVAGVVVGGVVAVATSKGIGALFD